MAFGCILGLNLEKVKKSNKYKVANLNLAVTSKHTQIQDSESLAHYASMALDNALEMPQMAFFNS